MKTVDVAQLPANVVELLRAGPRERILLTKGGRPYAILSDASHLDEEDIGYISDPAFWTMIAERRKRRGGVTLEEAYRRLQAREAREAA